MDVSINLYRYFALAAELESFTAAATRLRTTQAVVSNGIARLEQMLGFSLFDRNPRRLELTPQGRALLQEAQALIEAWDAADAALAAITEERPDTLRFGYPPYISEVPELDAVLDGFLALNPALSFENEIMLSSGLFIEVIQRRIDCAMVLGPPATQLSAFDMLSLRRLDTRLLLPAEHPLAALDSVPRAALAGLRLDCPLRHEAPYFFDLAIAPLEAAGAELVHARNPTFAGLYQAVRRERHVSIGFESLLSEEMLAAGKLVLRPIDPPIGAVELMLVREHGAINPMVDSLFAHMVERVGPMKKEVPR